MAESAEDAAAAKKDKEQREREGTAAPATSGASAAAAALDLNAYPAWFVALRNAAFRFTHAPPAQ